MLVAATAADRIVVTLDRGFGDVRRYPPGAHPGIVVLRVTSPDARTVSDALKAFLANEDLGDLTGCVVVVRGHLVRIRRPRLNLPRPNVLIDAVCGPR